MQWFGAKLVTGSICRVPNLNFVDTGSICRVPEIYSGDTGSIRRVAELQGYP